LGRRILALDKKISIGYLRKCVKEVKILRLWQITTFFLFFGLVLFSNVFLRPSFLFTSSARLHQRDSLARQTNPLKEPEIYIAPAGIFSLSEFLQEKQVTLYPEDKVEVFAAPFLGIGFQVKVYRADLVTVLDGGQRRIYRTWQKTVGEFLKEKGISVGEKDEVQPALDSVVKNGMEIQISRVSEEEIKEKLALPYPQIQKPDPSLVKGRTKVVQAGQTGFKVRTYRLVKKDGQVISKELIKEELLQEPKAEIIAYGTKIISYGRGVASFYLPSSQMLAASNVVPKGQWVRVVNLANGRSVDVLVVGGGLRSDRIIDLTTAAFQALGAPLSQGLILDVRLEKIDSR